MLEYHEFKMTMFNILMATREKDRNSKKESKQMLRIKNTVTEI